MKTEQASLTKFNRRLTHLQAVTGQTYGVVAANLGVSRTMLHYYRKGVHPPDAGVMLRLARAEEAAGIAPPLPESADHGGFAEAERERQIRWLRALRDQQHENVRLAQRHLREIEGWLAEAEGYGVEFDGDAPMDSRDAAGELLRDIDLMSLPIFGHLPAGWPQSRDGVAAQSPVRTVPVARGRFTDGAFGLEVRGESMNAAKPQPILDGDVVVLLPPGLREPKHGDIVAALIDGETTLKRLVNVPRPAHLRSESTNPAFKEIYPAHDLVIQGVVVGKL